LSLLIDLNLTGTCRYRWRELQPNFCLAHENCSSAHTLNYYAPLCFTPLSLLPYRDWPEGFHLDFCLDLLIVCFGIATSKLINPFFQVFPCLWIGHIFCGSSLSQRWRGGMGSRKNCRHLFRPVHVSARVALTCSSCVSPSLCISLDPTYNIPNSWIMPPIRVRIRSDLLDKDLIHARFALKGDTY
jgi:hypothetical protein